MNLDFGILWIEDSFSAEEERSLRRRVLEAGFIASVRSIPNGSGIDALAREHLLYHRFDLILLDYRLQDENGDELAIKIRQLFPSTNILFYSGTVDEAALRRLMAEREIEGVYCCARARFIERTGALIDQTARTLDRLSGMRGLAMRVVAECDELMKQTMLSMYKRDKLCVEKTSELDRDVFEFLDSAKKRYEASTEGDLECRLSTFAVDSSKIFKHFRRLTEVAVKNPLTFGLNPEHVERLRELRSNSAQYSEVVLKRRNILGHVVEIQAENGWVLKGSTEISVSDFPEIRRNFAVHIDAFREMGEMILLLDQQKAQ